MRSPFCTRASGPPTADSGRDVQGTGSVAGAGHAAVAEAHHVAHALQDELLRDRQLAPLGHAGSADGAGVAQDEHGVRGDIEIHVLDREPSSRVAVEDEGGAGVLQRAGWRRRV
jgi:hypothetical protein